MISGNEADFIEVNDLKVFNEIALGDKDAIAPLTITAGTSEISYKNGLSILSAASGAIRAALTVINDDSGRFLLYDADTITRVILQADGDSYFNGGNVGIGTITPGSKLAVVGLPTSATGLATGDFFTQTAAELGGTGTTKVICAA